MIGIKPPQILLPSAEIARTYEQLREMCNNFLSADTIGVNKVEAHDLWAKFLRCHTLLALVRAVENVQKHDPAPDRLAKWGRQCGVEAVPYLLLMHEHSRGEAVRRGSLVAIAAACAVELGTSTDDARVKGIPPDSAPPRNKRSRDFPRPEGMLRIMIEGIDEPLSLADTLAITKDWEATNHRRLELIEKKSRGDLTPEKNPLEWAEFEHLQNLAGIKRQLADPLPIKELAEIEADLKRRGLWQGA